jgi:hypothetical protein
MGLQQYAIDGDPDLEDEIDEQLECGYEPIEGYMEGNIGWAMLHRVDMTADFYHHTWGFVDVWPLYYQCPPGIAIC